jgi:hypothetical protein
LDICFGLRPAATGPIATIAILAEKTGPLLNKEQRPCSNLDPIFATRQNAKSSSNRNNIN